MKKRKAQDSPKLSEHPSLGKILLLAGIGLFVSFPFTFTFLFWPYIGYTERIWNKFPDEILHWIIGFSSFVFLLTFFYYMLWAYYARRVIVSIEDNKILAGYLSFLLNSVVMLFSVSFSILLKLKYVEYFEDDSTLGVSFVHFYFYIGGMILSYFTSSFIMVIITRKFLQI